MEEGSTCAPSLLSEADLIALMEKHGIGTDATHAEHIETIKSRMYAGVQDDGRFLPRSLGMGLVKGYDAMGIALSKPNLRAELEADLKRFFWHQQLLLFCIKLIYLNYIEFAKELEIGKMF